MPQDAADAQNERLKVLHDQLALIETAPTYIAGEQWAVSAVIALRNEIANFERQWGFDDCPFAKGDVVTVFNARLNGYPIIEGEAEIIRATGVQHQYSVRFHGKDRGVYERFVWRDQQRDPELWLRNAQRLFAAAPDQVPA